MNRAVIFGFVLLSGTGMAQVNGAFSVEKTSFAQGEPVVLSFVMHNEGKASEEVMTADPYAFCSGYKIKVTYDSAPPVSCFLRSYGGSCANGAIALAPGASRTEHILLNYQNTSRGELGLTVRLPGDYTVEASREIGYAEPGRGSLLFNSPSHSEVHATFHLRVDKDRKAPSATYDQYVLQLESKDWELRREAARTLATMAPAALEPLLLTFATAKDPMISQFAPLALANLGTKASLAALAGMLLVKQPGSYEHMMAADLLGKTHDAAWMPLLVETADQHGAMYLIYAAESGGEKAIPVLLARLREPSADVRGAVITALGYTGSRAAVPLLIGMLRTPVGMKDEEWRDVAAGANGALAELTHIYAERGVDGSVLGSWHDRWQQWWVRSGADAPIYKAGECGVDAHLP